MTKKIYVYTIANLQKAPNTAGLENVPDSQSSAYRRKHYHLLKQNVHFKCSYL